jgi:Glycosyl hydrolases family 2, TIM barrel domain
MHRCGPGGSRTGLALRLHASNGRTSHRDRWESRPQQFLSPKGRDTTRWRTGERLATLPGASGTCDVIWCIRQECGPSGQEEYSENATHRFHSGVARLRIPEPEYRHPPLRPDEFMSRPVPFFDTSERDPKGPPEPSFFGTVHRTSPVPLTKSGLQRPVVRGKFIYVGNDKFLVRGVTYGAFRPDADGHEYHDLQMVERDFAQMSANGMNAVRIPHTMPSRHVLDIAQKHGLRVMVGHRSKGRPGYPEDSKRQSAHLRWSSRTPLLRARQ